MTAPAPSDDESARTCDVDVAIVGAGPVGLYLALRLALDGRTVTLLERRTAPSGATRAIGIHPPGLEALDRVGAGEAVRAAGCEITAGDAFTVRNGGRPKRLGSIDFFRTLPDPYRFVLTVPQPDTERILEARLREVAPDVLRRGTEVVGWEQDPEMAQGSERSRVRLKVRDPATATPRTLLLVLCDGANAGAAERLGIPVRGGATGDAYLMADADASEAPVDPSPNRARVVLHADGVIETFPLPGGRRRWVAKTDGLVDPPDVGLLLNLLRLRIGTALDPATVTAPSSFAIRRRAPVRLGTGPIWLAGDAAHVVAPIGGQGMTLGWLGAETLAAHAGAWLDGRCSRDRALAAYEATQRARAARADARATWNVRMGRATHAPWLRDVVVRTWLTGPLAGRLARTFAMRR